MKKISTFFLCIIMGQGIYAQNETERNSFGAPLRASNFSLAMELTSKYMWRGIEYGTSPVLFPTIAYSTGGFYAYAMGGYAINGSHQEVDMGISYTLSDFTLAVNDYYYPTEVGAGDQYFNFRSAETGHWAEATLSYTPSRLPFWILVSSYFAGADKNADGDQAFSSYAEIGLHYDFLQDSQLSLAVGAALNDSFYNDYEGGFSICNIHAKYTYNAQIGSFTLPLSASYIINPYREKSFVTFSAVFGF